MNTMQKSLSGQFGASINMLKNAISMWPDELWYTDKRFFYIAYHCLVFLDYYLTVPAKPLSSPLAFTITEPDQIPKEAKDDLVPNIIYSKSELLDYLEFSRQKCRALIAGLTEEKAAEAWIDPEGGRNYAVLELLLYNMRHVQHHAAQLNLLLRQTIDQAPAWVSRDTSQ